MISDRFEEESYWADVWIRHIENYLLAPPRCGIWLKSRLNNELSVIECAGGSCRDSRYLYDQGYKSVGSDFDEKTIDYIHNKFPESNFKILREDAFNLSFGDKGFDCSFHSGFWILYKDDYKIIELLKEQRRISKNIIISLVHNVKNSQSVKLFKEKAETDDLYKIRFFSQGELINILEKSSINYKSYSFEKFGGPVDRLYDLENSYPILSKLIRWAVPRLYRFQPWSKVERIAFVINL